METNEVNALELLVQRERQQILAVAQAHGAEWVKIFGSVAKKKVTLVSDLDLLIRLKPDYGLLDLIASKQDLEDLLGYPVDVVTETALSPYIREQVLREATPL